MAINKFLTFKNDAQSLQIGEITVENGTDSLKIYGQHNFDFSQAGLADLKLLAQIINDGIALLDSQSGLPKTLGDKPADAMTNPFS
jgi:hypothetical protein